MVKLNGPRVRPLCICAILLCSNINGAAQAFLNLDFEYAATKNQPRKWSVEGEGNNYFARLDSTNAKAGNRSLYIKQEKAEVFTFLRLPGREISGKTIKVEGYILLPGDHSLQAKLLFAAPGTSLSFASKTADSKQHNWQKISNESSIPANFSSDVLLVALGTSGTGRCWFDHVAISINGRPYGNGHPDIREPTKREIAALNKSVIPVPILKERSKDFTRLKHIIGDARVIGMGENSHGSSSIYQLKLAFLKLLVREFGFNIFALEMPVADAETINRYVLYGEGTKKDVLSSLAYKSWRTQDMLDILNWLRSYNMTVDKKVSFQGFDSQNNGLSIVKVKHFAEKHDKLLYQNLINLENLGERKEHTDWQGVYKKTDSINKYLASKNISDYPGVALIDFLQVKYNMRICLQSLASKYRTDSTKSRDEYMAGNIDWILQNASPADKIIVSADNTHVSKVSGKMGHYLRMLYGNKYLAWGFTFNDGTYSAYGQKAYYEVHPSYTGTAEYLLSKLNYKSFLLDIRNTSNVQLTRPIGFRSIGSRPQETTQFSEINLRDHFDILVFIETSVHTNYLDDMLKSTEDGER